MSSASAHHPQLDASEVAHTQEYRRLASAPSDQVTGHWRAINPSVTRSMTATGGASDPQIRAVRDPDLSDSQADSAGSIPVSLSRSNREGPGQAVFLAWALIVSG